MSIMVTNRTEDRHKQRKDSKVEDFLFLLRSDAVFNNMKSETEAEFSSNLKDFIASKQISGLCLSVLQSCYC